jgi:ADP-ribose pyrophosphatase YjhB (NUDIX family)
MNDPDRDLAATSRKRRLSHAVREFWPLRFALKIAAAIVAPRQPVGVVGVLFNDEGRVLLAEHVFRTDFPWGLPGGWIERGEVPERALLREFEEELGLQIEVGPLLQCGVIGLVEKSTHPRHLGLAFCCRLKGGTVRATHEVVSTEWADPRAPGRTLAPFQRRAIELAVARLPFEGDHPPADGRA